MAQRVAIRRGMQTGLIALMAAILAACAPEPAVPTARSLPTQPPATVTLAATVTQTAAPATFNPTPTTTPSITASDTAQPDATEESTATVTAQITDQATDRAISSALATTDNTVVTQVTPNVRPSTVLTSVNSATPYTAAVATEPPANAISGSATPTLPPTFTPTATPTMPSLTDAPRPSTSVIIHVVTANENLIGIARRYGLTVEQVAAANKVYNYNNLIVGQQLIIPIQVRVAPTATPTPTWTPGGPTATPIEDLGILTPTPNTQASSLQTLPQTLNGLPISSMISIDDTTRTNMRQIFACGLKHNDNNPRAFSKMGDCNSTSPYFLGRFDKSEDGLSYNLGTYSALQPVIEHYTGSFGRVSVATEIGLHSWSVFDPAWADKRLCNRGEDVIDCELRLQNPSVLIIALGTNDFGAPTLFEKHMRRILETTLTAGVVPVLTTKSDRYDAANKINAIIRALAKEYHVPLWDYDQLAATIPGRGLDTDGIHMTMFYSHDYTEQYALTRGHGAQNIAALYMLQDVMTVLDGVTAADCAN